MSDQDLINLLGNDEPPPGGLERLHNEIQRRQRLRKRAAGVAAGLAAIVMVGLFVSSSAPKTVSTSSSVSLSARIVSKPSILKLRAATSSREPSPASVSFDFTSSIVTVSFPPRVERTFVVLKS